MPTFVECKRFDDTRSRREVVGQMLEYAANGHHYWTSEDLREFAESSAKNQDSDLDKTIQSIDPEINDSTDDYIDAIISYLREGQIRLVFFMEEAPMELKSIVDFLNKQIQRSEVLIVEAQQYEHNEMRVVFPSLFGYTEEARRIKKSITVNSGSRRKWDEGSFFSDLENKVNETDFDIVRKLYDYCLSQGFYIKWGSGSRNGSWNPVLSTLSPKSIFTLS